MKSNFSFWKDVWNSKGNSRSEDLLFLDGYEHLGVDFSSKKITDNIISTLEVPIGSSILEVGCGCGFLSRELSSDYDYVGIDYSDSIIKKHKSLFNHKVHTCAANDLFFEDKSFDYVFCYGVFQYLPDLEYANRVVSEILRVARIGVFIGDLKNKKTRETHFVFPKENFKKLGFSIVESNSDIDESKRYNVYRRTK
jgi:ubiquinone/menaquinone biosynthesis C-methylase UbiE